MISLGYHGSGEQGRSSYATARMPVAPPPWREDCFPLRPTAALDRMTLADAKEKGNPTDIKSRLQKLESDLYHTKVHVWAKRRSRGTSSPSETSPKPRIIHNSPIQFWSEYTLSRLSPFWGWWLATSHHHH